MHRQSSCGTGHLGEGRTRVRYATFVAAVTGLCGPVRCNDLPSASPLSCCPRVRGTASLHGRSGPPGRLHHLLVTIRPDSSDKSRQFALGFRHLARGRPFPCVISMDARSPPRCLRASCCNIPAMRTIVLLGLALLLCGTQQAARASDSPGPGDTARKVGHEIAGDTRQFAARVAQDSKRFGHSVATDFRQVGADTRKARRRIVANSRKAGASIAQGARAAGASLREAVTKAKAALTQ
jgi:hypothetical protein